MALKFTTEQFMENFIIPYSHSKIDETINILANFLTRISSKTKNAYIILYYTNYIIS